MIDSGEITADADADPAADAEANALAALEGADETPVDSVEIDEGTLEQLERRGLVEISETTVREVTLTELAVTELMAGLETAETVGQVTPELLTSGDWADVEFAEYNVEADAERVEGGNVHILRQTAERVKDVLVGMGFQEMEGPHVDADFWINDCLFMPQDHPARTHWDRFALEEPTHIDDLPEGLVSDVEQAHRQGVGPDGEGYHSRGTRTSPARSRCGDTRPRCRRATCPAPRSGRSNRQHGSSASRRCTGTIRSIRPICWNSSRLRAG